MGNNFLLNGQTIELGVTNPQGLAIGRQNGNRKLIQWNVPNQGLVQMYVNPESMSTTERKLLKETRTKGGYIVQYWGTALPEININGTTGSGGIEGINVLRSIYLQEQIGFGDIISQLNSGFMNNLFQASIDTLQGLANNPLTTAISSTVNSLASLGNGVNTPTSAASFFNDITTIVGNVANVFDSIGRSITTDQQLIPTLAALATSLEMIYDGVTYRGFMKEFVVDEKASEIGLFRYSIKFTVTRRTGSRSNGFAWQRSVTNGPANSDIVPFTFGALEVPGGQSVTIPAPPTAAAPVTSLVSRRSQLTG